LDDSPDDQSCDRACVSSHSAASHPIYLDRCREACPSKPHFGYPGPAVADREPLVSEHRIPAPPTWCSRALHVHQPTPCAPTEGDRPGRLTHDDHLRARDIVGVAIWLPCRQRVPGPRAAADRLECHLVERGQAVTADGPAGIGPRGPVRGMRDRALVA
jgi:hypothetical protein